MLGKTEGRRRRGDTGWDGWMASLTRWTWVFGNSGREVMDREDWCAAVHGVANSWMRLALPTRFVYICICGSPCVVPVLTLSTSWELTHWKFSGLTQVYWMKNLGVGPSQVILTHTQVWETLECFKWVKQISYFKASHLLFFQFTKLLKTGFLCTVLVRWKIQ